jgi:hypothetical protein
MSWLYVKDYNKYFFKIQWSRENVCCLITFCTNETKLKHPHIFYSSKRERLKFLKCIGFLRETEEEILCVFKTGLQ